MKATGLSSKEFKDGKAEIGILVERYEQASQEDERVTRWPVLGKLTLCYAVGRKKQEPEAHRYQLPLVTSACHYGGVRWWMVAPCCGNRIRVLYLSASITVPTCRACLDLHYPSQTSSYIERHIAYEKHLLRNYGYYWAFNEYHMMKKHYFVVTPEWERIKRRSELERELELIRHLISFNRVLLRTHIHALRSIKQREEKELYISHIAREHGKSYALDLVRLLNSSLQIERDAWETSERVFERLYRDATPSEGEPPEKEGKLPDNLRHLIMKKDELLEELEELEKVA